MAFLTEQELSQFGFKSYGKNVLVSTRASFYGISNISIGDNVRIDDFCLLSAVNGYINLHSHIHISAYASIFGRGGVEMQDFSGISSYVSVYSANDDYSGNYLIGPINDADLTNVAIKPVMIEKYSQCGSHSVVLPGVTMSEGSILGANSLASKSLDAWSVYSGVPAKLIKERSKGLIDKAKIMEERWLKAHS